MLTAVCVMLPSSQGGPKGYIKMTQPSDRGPVYIWISLRNVPEGKHGLHIHKYGSMVRGCDSMGEHYNPTGGVHGDLNEKDAHLGDLGNAEANYRGEVSTTLVAHRIKLRDVIGRGLVLHENEDDLGREPNDESLRTGNSGDRIACGVIGLSPDD